MIYFIQSEDGGSIKIGCTELIPFRLKQLRSRTRRRLKVLAIMDGSFPEERALHDRFAHLRKEGEWFDDAPELTQFIQVNGRPWSQGMSEQGRIIAKKLVSLGLGYERVRVTEVANLVSQRTGVKMTPGTLGKILNSVWVSPQMINRLAEGLGVDPSELIQDDEGES
jgi:transcriptional regulator with XRE-family HTH domain